jgi:hypothetical protein
MIRRRTALEHFQTAIAAGLSQGWILNATGEPSGVTTDAEREGVLTTDDLEIPEAALVSRRTDGIWVQDQL